MTLTTHAIVGASVAQFFPQHPILAFSAGFVSHFVMDSIPHWDYKIFSLHQDKQNQLNNTIATNDKVFLLDLFRIGSDFWIGILLSLFLFSALTTSPWITLLGALGGIMPDPLQFVYWKFRHEPIISLQKFHMWTQRHNHLMDAHPTFGKFFQIGVVIFFVGIVYAFKKPFGL